MRIASDLFRSSGGDDFAALIAAFGTEIHQPIGGFDDVEIVLDDEKRGAGLEQFAKRGEKFGDVLEVQAGGGLVEDIEDAVIFRPRKIGSQLEALRFAARKRGCRLAEAKITEADFVEHAQLGNDFGNTGEKSQGFARGHLENIVDILAAIANVENAGLEASAAAFLADELDVGEKLHFNGDGAIALAGLAAATGDVERKMTGGEPAALGIGRRGKDFANGIKGLEIGGGVGAGRASNGRLIHDHDFAEMLIALEALAELADACARALRGERAVQNIVNQSGFAGAADAGDHREHAQRKHEIHVLKIVQGSAFEAEKFSAGLMTNVWDGNIQFAAEIPAGERSVLGEHSVVGAGEEETPAEFASAWAEVNDAIRGTNRIGIMLDDEDGVAEIAERLEDVNEALRIARMKADGRFVQNVERADEMRAERSGELDALGFAAGESRGQAIEGEIVEADFIEKLKTRANFLEDFFSDLVLCFGKREGREKRARFLDGKLAKLGDGMAGDADGAGFGAQAGSAAIRASGIPAIAAQKDADVQFIFFAFEPSEKSFDTLESVFRVAFEDETALLRG